MKPVPVPSRLKEAVLRIHNILVSIRIRGSMPLTNSDPDPDADPGPVIFFINLQDANKKLIFKISFSAYYGTF
jgi:hypothetical protein